MHKTLCGGLNDVVRIQKFGHGGFQAKHTDRSIRVSESSESSESVSKYSLRIFLNEAFQGGLSVFHVPFEEPVVFQPTTGMALLYPQGELCTPQEETEVTCGTKYVLRADVLFH